MLRKTVFTKDWPSTAYITMGSGLKGDPDVAGRVLLYHTVVRDPFATEGYDDESARYSGSDG
jgi:hypothetical protein